VKKPDQLFEIYLKSVGRGGGMNLGLAPMPEGILHDNDILSLKSFGQKLKETFDKDLTAGAMAKASNVRENHEQFATSKLFDGDRYSYYASDDQVLRPSIEISLPSARTFDLIRLRENIKLGQRLDSVKVSVWENNGWRLIGEATSIGANRLIKLASPVTAQRLKVDLFAPVAPTLSEFALFKEAASNFGLATTERKRVAKQDMTIISADKHVMNAIDNNLRSIWETTTSRSKFVEIRLTKNEWITGMQYTPRQDAKLDGVPTKYKVYSSVDGKTWQIVATGEFSNIKANATGQMINFRAPVEAHYIRFEPMEVLSGDKAFSVAEFDLFVK